MNEVDQFTVLGPLAMLATAGDALRLSYKYKMLASPSKCHWAFVAAPLLFAKGLPAKTIKEKNEEIKRRDEEARSHKKHS